jgi:hypothetical protein
MFFILFYVIYLFIQQFCRWAFAVVHTCYDLPMCNQNPLEHNRCFTMKDFIFIIFLQQFNAFIIHAII